jgi:epoxide hydrolase-like predicted phosphatase
MNYKHAIFDFGGVVQPNIDDAFDYIAQEYNLSRLQVEQVRSKHVVDLRTGKIDVKEFWMRFFSEFNLPLPEDYEKLWLINWQEKFELYQPVIDLVKELQSAAIVCTVLSNTITPHANFARERGGYDIFDHLFLSHEIGMQKPDRDIYEFTLHELNAKPEESIFIDDYDLNLVVPQELGITTILASSPEQIVVDVNKLLDRN